MTSLTSRATRLVGGWARRRAIARQRRTAEWHESPEGRAWIAHEQQRIWNAHLDAYRHHNDYGGVFGVCWRGGSGVARDIERRRVSEERHAAEELARARMRAVGWSDA